MKQKSYLIFGIIILVIITGTIIINYSLQKENISIKWEIYETNVNGKAPFTCSLVPRENYTITGKEIAISFNGNNDSFNFEIVKIINKAVSYNNQNISMNYHLYPDNKESTFYATLFIGNNSELYNCYGGIATPVSPE